MNIKKLGIGLEWSTYSELKEHHVLSQGWNGFCDLSFMFHNPNELWTYIDYVSEWQQSGKNAIKQIMQDIKVHDIILAFEGNTVKGIAEVPERFVYYYATDIKYYQNCIFPINWVDWKDFCDDDDIRGQGGQGVQGIVNCNNPQNLVEYIRKNWNNYKKQHDYVLLPDECVDKLNYLLEHFEEARINSKKKFLSILNRNNHNYMIKEYIQLLENNHNLILTGAPGTGKTYLAQQIAKSLESVDERYGFVQFHPSYDYSDFVEGLRPIKNEHSKEISFERKDGVFMSFCRKALEAYQSSANKQEAPKYVFVIDEINRGEMSKIFGEMFFSIDPGYRGKNGRISTQYANLWTEDDVFDATLSNDDKYKFYVPENVYVIGTMNDIDRSVESMDFAMRRRFAWKEVTSEFSQTMLDSEKAWKNNMPDPGVIDAIKIRMNNLNLCILTIQGLNSAYQIGAAYFLKLSNYLEDGYEDSSYDSLWNNHIYGLLFEYLRGLPNQMDLLNDLRKAYDLKVIYEKRDNKVVKINTSNEE